MGGGTALARNDEDDEDGGRTEPTAAAGPRTARLVGSRENVGGGTNARRAIVSQHSADRHPRLFL